MSPWRSTYCWLLGIGLGLSAFTQALAAELASPGVEVKFFLNPSLVLDLYHQPNSELRSVFAVTETPLAIRMEFLDSPTHELHAEHWNVRLRKMEGQDALELTFKRRYPVCDGLKAALTTAAQEGFGAAERDYEPELEWGYEKQTLTFANEKQAKGGKAHTLQLPAVEEAQKLVAGANLPGKLRHWKEDGWAKHILSSARLYGPVDGWRWRGRQAEIDDTIALEVWAVPNANGSGTEPMVEISFKKKEYDERAATKREKLRALLEEKGWLLKEDVLKTERILQRSGQSTRCR